ncbi:MAG: hypothetical protein LBD23_01475 [Oscillospiraceae bacterium]|jgi:hypothetical protein|nr:hypothetical protein [Oscillospiraceae bacterium]
MTNNAVPKAIAVILVIVILYFGYETYNEGQHQPLQITIPIINNNVEQIPTPPIPFPNTSPIVNEADFTLYANFRVEPIHDGEHHYFVRLKHIDNRDYDRDFYIRKGEILETVVLHGEYYMYYASGTEWYGTEYLFGTNAQCFRAVDPISFFWDDDDKVSKGNVIYLELVFDGNLSTIPVNISSFNE